MPFSFIVDPSAQFQPGQVAQLNVFGNQVVCGVSDGTAPIGIIDDQKTTAFTAVAINEHVVVPAVGTIVNGQLVTVTDIQAVLENPHILPESFMADVDVYLIATNGVIVIPPGTPLNHDQMGTGAPDSVRVVVSYTYKITNTMVGDDSTAGSGRITVFFQRLIAETTMFETNQFYPLNAPLFSSARGLLTTQQHLPNQPSIALVTGPPSSIHRSLQFMLL